MKKDKTKLEKDHKSKMNEINIERRKSMDEARAKTQENVKLEEVNKTLQGILKMNTELYEKRKENKEDITNENDAEDIEVDDFIEAMRNNREAGYSRTNPATKANSNAATGARPKETTTIVTNVTL